MRHLLIFLSLSFFSCKEPKVAEEKSIEPMISFEWLIGNWERSNDEPGQTTYENWTKANESRYDGVGFTMQGSDTVWQENTKLMKKGTAWIFSATGKGESKSTDFILTTMTDNSFVCENAANEFPKKIDYHLLGDSLRATISGGGPEIVFLFGKKK